MATNILLTDKLASPLGASTVPRRCFTPYGYHRKPNPLQTGFAGERLDEVAGVYHLGQGHRTFDPVLMRLRSSDSRSPFAEGGLNSYAYCANDPINYTDPSGRKPVPATALRPRVPLPTPASLSAGETAQHYFARGLTAGGAVSESIIDFVAQSASNYRWAHAAQGVRKPLIRRIIDIVMFHSRASSALGSAFELMLPPTQAGRASTVSYLELVNGGGFVTASTLAIADGLRTEGLGFFKLDWRSIRYTARELTLIGPVADLASDAYHLIRNKNRGVSNASRDIPMTVASAASPANTRTARQIRRASV